jgi:hypothetical protein
MMGPMLIALMPIRNVRPDQKVTVGQVQAPVRYET